MHREMHRFRTFSACFIVGKDANLIYKKYYLRLEIEYKHANILHLPCLVFLQSTDCNADCLIQPMAITDY